MNRRVELDPIGLGLKTTSYIQETYGVARTTLLTWEAEGKIELVTNSGKLYCNEEELKRILETDSYKLIGGKEYYGVGTTAARLGIGHTMLRNWGDEGKLEPDYVSDKGTRYYLKEKVEGYTKYKPTKKTAKSMEWCLGYVACECKGASKVVTSYLQGLEGVLYRVLEGGSNSIKARAENYIKLLAMLESKKYSKVVVVRNTLFEEDYEKVRALCSMYNTELVELEMD